MPNPVPNQHQTPPSGEVPEGRRGSGGDARRAEGALLCTVFLIAICGLIYELLISTLSSYLFGNSVLHFSITIGLFMSAMGLGSYLSRFMPDPALEGFLWIEMAVGVVGGVSAAVLYAVFATGTGYYVTMVGLILIIGVLVGLEIPLVTRILGGRAALKNTLSNVLAFDYLGALLASILFPTVLLPILGLLKTAFVTGLMNLAVAGFNVWLFRDQLTSRSRFGIPMAIAGLLLLVGAVGSTPLSSFFERQLYQDAVVYSEQSSYQRIVLTRSGSDLRLYLDGNLQFSTRDEHRYHESLVHPAMTLSRSRASVLILGGGDGLAVREVLKYADVEHITLVDLDPAMTELGRSFPALRSVNGDALRDERVHFVHQDAFSFLSETNERFGVVLIDLPDPNNEQLGKLYSREFYTFVRRRLARGGVMASQATSPYFAREAFWSIVNTATDAGLNTYPYHIYVPSFGDWGFVLTAEHEVDLEAFQPMVPLQYLTAERVAAGQVFDPDMARVSTEVSTLDHPAVLTYYQRGWKQWN